MEVKGREKQIVDERIKKIEALKKEGINPYAHRFDLHGERGYSSDLQKKFSKLKDDAKSGEDAVVAGRIMTKRSFGKLSFCSLQDLRGTIQIVVQKDESSEDAIGMFKKVDTGDIIGVKGEVVKTRTGEVSILAQKVFILTKSILPLPDKHKGLQDKEERYRKRYLDLIINPEVKDVFLKRARVIDTIRSFLKKDDFIEVETPALQPLYGGAEARPFITELHALKMKLYLSISPEIYLKKLLVGGIEKNFTICKNFRNEGIDATHNPEFTMMEAYASYWDYNDVRKMTEQLLEKIAKDVCGGTDVEYQGKTLNFKAPFNVMTIEESIKKYCKIDPCDESKLKSYAKKNGFSGTNDQLLHFIFDEKVEHNLTQPTFITDYPKSTCPLTKDHRDDDSKVERFELFIDGMEVANAYSELNDPEEQERRLKSQLKGEGRLEKFEAHFEANAIDEDFVNSLKVGMPPAGGVGIGIDRIVMFFTDQPSIRDVIFFPFMKPEVSEKKKTSKRKS